MMIIMLLMMVAYMAMQYIVARQIVLQLEDNMESRVAGFEKTYQNLGREKEEAFKAKMDLEEESIKIFTLYEITKLITQTYNEQEAFEIFKNRLKQYIAFDECILMDPFADVNALRKEKDYFIFTLQGKARKIGYLCIKGVREEDKDKLLILSHQFALSLRRVKLYQEIEKIAITDSLTELHTRRYILERLEEEIKRSKVRKIKMSFLMVDVDHFKTFNDKYGHLAGDQILREVGRIIKENIRGIDIAGRYGGEEFCIILPDTDRAGAKFAGERIRLATEQATIKAYDTSVQATVSIGVATFPDDVLDVQEMIDKADWALYRAKNTGRNRVVAFGIYKD